MRRRSGCPANRTPNRSKTSRSYQLAAGKYADDARHRIDLVGRDLHPDAQVLIGTQEQIDDFEALHPAGVVDTQEIDEADEAATWIVTQERQDAHDVGRGRGNRQLAMREDDIRDRVPKLSGDPVAEALQFVVHVAGLA